MRDQLEFLKTVKPFDLLPEEVLQGVAELLQEVTYTKESILYLQDVSKMRGVDIIVEGEYEAFFYDSEQNKRLIAHYNSGYCYGGSSILLNRKKSIRTVIAKKGTVVYTLHRKEFIALCQAYEGFFHYFTADYGRKMLDEEYAHFVRPTSAAAENYIAADQLYSRRIETVEPREIVACSVDTPIHEAAKIMVWHKISCLFVKNEQDTIIGYVTDLTLRNNVVAQQVDVNRPVQEVMDQPIIFINNQAYVYEAILLMFQTHARYILIEKNDAYTGFISRNKLLGSLAQSPFMFIQSVKLSRSVQELRQKWQKVPSIVYQLLNRGVKSEIVNQVITTVSDTIAVRVIEGVIQEMGPPPARFVFMVLGSEGRQEQTLKTDQDNAIIYEDKANEQREIVREYFLNFAALVSERLDHIGFSFCEGGFMAKNPKWTHSLSHWKRNYQTWLEESDPEAVLKVATFFDCRYLYGEMAIMDELKAFLHEELKTPHHRFLHRMAENALQYEPPLTFFNNIRTFSKGSQQVFNLKKTMSPIVDLVRAYALKNRIFKTNTGERLEALTAQGVFTQKEQMELLQAYYYLMGMRLKKQAFQIIDDKTEPDNYIDPKSLTKIEQVTLKEIFKVISDFQTKIKVGFMNLLY
ncbi:signal transduction protein [Pontibacter sp. HJ8]